MLLKLLSLSLFLSLTIASFILHSFPRRCEKLVGLTVVGDVTRRLSSVIVAVGATCACRKLITVFFFLCLVDALDCSAPTPVFFVHVVPFSAVTITAAAAAACLSICLSGGVQGSGRADQDARHPEYSGIYSWCRRCCCC